MNSYLRPAGSEALRGPPDSSGSSGSAIIGDSALVAGVDRHGLKNILGEKFVNVHFDRAKTGAEILGVTINNLLRGLFFINGNILTQFSALDLPGGITAWDDVLETIYVNLSTIMTAQEYNSRLIVLCKLFVSTPSSIIGHILSGAIVFTYTWTSKFNGYLSREQLHELRVGVTEAVSILAPHFPSTASAPASNNHDRSTEKHSIHTRVYEYSVQLNEMLDHLSDDRHCLARGLQPSPARWRQQALIRTFQDPTNSFSRLQISEDAAQRHHVFNPHPVLTLPSLAAVVGSIHPTNRDRRDTMKEEFLKLAAQAASAQTNIEIFGISSSMLANMSDSDSDDDGSAAIKLNSNSLANSHLSKSVVGSAQSGNNPVMEAFTASQRGSKQGDNIYGDPQLSQSLGHRKLFDASTVFFDDSASVFANSRIPSQALTPQSDRSADAAATDTPHTLPVRLPSTFNLAQNPDSFIDNIWFFDTLELARQWTLVDFSMFVSIPLTAMMGELTWTKPRHRADVGASAIRRCVLGVRHMCKIIVQTSCFVRFTDRFNAISTWTSHSILQPHTPGSRALIYEQIVELAGCLESLGNYSSLMAIISGLKQGCISRLSVTKKMVKRATMEKLAKLEVLLTYRSGTKC
jgi:hypothetical protein